MNESNKLKQEVVFSSESLTFTIPAHFQVSLLFQEVAGVRALGLFMSVTYKGYSFDTGVCVCGGGDIGSYRSMCLI